MVQRTIKGSLLRVFIAFLFPLSIFEPSIVKADENGVSFWLPGLYGSLAATPQQPGWSFAATYYHASVSAGGSVLRPVR